MTWILNDKEIKSVLALDGPKRYLHFIKKVADERKLWSLRQKNDWALICDDHGHELIPVWPHEKYALLCANGIWANYRPDFIEIDEWFTRWTPGMEKDGRLVAIFTTPEDNGIVVTPKQLESDLREELSLYESSN